MSRVFRVTPKRVKRTNGTVLTPEMEVTVTTQTHTSDPFYNGAKELKEAYMRMYGFDYQKACCSKNDFDFKYQFFCCFSDFQIKTFKHGRKYNFNKAFLFS